MALVFQSSQIRFTSQVEILSFAQKYNMFIEIKGYYTEVFKQKIKAVLSQNTINLKIIDKMDDIKNWIII